MIKEKLKEVEENIEKACKRANRNKDDVTLIAVSKTKPTKMILEAMDYGTVDFGENKVQELVSKYEEINDSKINWHLIGHLQRNKVKYIIDKVCLIHSVDSLRLAEQISSEAKKKGLVCDILLEVNVANEETKFGISVDECLDLVEKIALLEGVHIKGLMTVAPYVVDPEENREIFRKLRKLSVDIKSKNIDNVSMEVLSMGMTNDYEVAIEEGATLVRVGSGIFGERQYSR